MASLPDEVLMNMTDRELLLHLAREYREVRDIAEKLRDGAADLISKANSNPLLRGMFGG